MKCPYCGNEMELGKLRSRGGVFFLPDGEKTPKLYTQKQMVTGDYLNGFILVRWEF